MSRLKKVSIKKNSSKGFTLIELLVVIAIIGILATLVLLQVGSARAKARDAKRVADVSQIRSALELYLDENTTYPLAVQDGGAGPYRPVTTGMTYLGGGTVPKDPSTAQNYPYAVNSATPTKYQIWSELENYTRAPLTSDSDVNTLAAGTWQPNASGDGTGTPGVDGASEAATCTAAAAEDCVYDLGLR
jgi:type II secretion system protein G